MHPRGRHRQAGGGSGGLRRGGGSSGHLNQMDASASSPSSPSPSSASAYLPGNASPQRSQPFPPPPQLHTSPANSTSPHSQHHPSTPPALPMSSSPPSVFRHPSLHPPPSAAAFAAVPSSDHPAHTHSYQPPYQALPHPTTSLASSFRQPGSGGGQRGSGAGATPVLSPSPHQQAASSFSSSSSSRPALIPKQHSSPSAAFSPTSHPSSSHSSPASSTAASRADPLSPSSPPSSDSSPRDDETDEVKPLTPIIANPEADSLRRTIEHLHRVHLGGMLREQALEKQLKEAEARMRALEKEKAEGSTTPYALTSPTTALSPTSSTSSSPVARALSAASRTRGEALASLPCPLPLPGPLSQHLSSLLLHISPSRASEQRRISVLSWLKALIRKSLGAQCYPVNSYALKTYLANELMTVSAFFSRAHEPSWLQRVVNALCQEAYATGSAGGVESGGGADVSVPTASALYLLQSVTVFFATSKQHAVVRCCIGGIEVSIYGNNVPALGSLALFEHVDHLVGRDHLFKRAIVLLKAWASAHGIYGGGEEDVLLSGLFLRTLMLFTVNRFHALIHTPLDALLSLLAYVEDYDWDTTALSIYGPVLLSSIDSNRLEAVADGPHAWPADLTPLVPTELIHGFQVQTRKDAMGSGASAAGGLGHHTGSASAMPRVNSAMFLDIPAEGAVPGRSNSDTNLAGKVSRSSSSSSLSSLPVASQAVPITVPMAVPVAAAQPKDADRFTPLQQMRPLFPTGSTFRSKSYTSLASMDNTPDHSPQPLPASYHGGQHGEMYLNTAPGSFTSTSASSSTSSLSSSSTQSSPPFPPTISSSQLGLAAAASRPPSSFDRASDNEEDDDDASSESYSTDDESPTPRPSTASAAPSPLDLYTALHAEPGIPAYPTCSLNVLDAIERGKNLGVNVVYRYQYRVRSVLSEGYARLRDALRRAEERARKGEEVEEDVEEPGGMLREIFDAATLSEYKERLYRELKARAATSPTSASPSPVPDDPDSAVAPIRPSIPTRTLSGPLPVLAEQTPVRSTLNPHSSEFIPSSSLTLTSPTPLKSSHPAAALTPSSPSTPNLLSDDPSILPSFLFSPTSSSSFDPLDGNLPKVLANLTHARQFELPSITERDLLALLTAILLERGHVPVGRLGSLLHDRTNNHSLPAVLKESYGGLKRLLERHPDVFVVGKDHPYNPHVRLSPRVMGAAAGGADGAAGVTAGGKRKVQRRRTRVRRVNQRGSHGNLAGLTASPGSASGVAAVGTRPTLTAALALDCEMIGVGSGGLHSILARVSLVNSHLDPVYDSFVQPSEPVTDYRTHVSGITAEQLRDAPPFAVVQREVAGLIKGRVLVGHGLGGDMQVLCLGHPRYLLRDTAHCKLICPVRPLGLKRLMLERFGLDVQEGQHDSVEDARCAMRLYLQVQAEWEHSLSTQGQLHVNEPQTTVYHIMP